MFPTALYINELSILVKGNVAIIQKVTRYTVTKYYDKDLLTTRIRR